MKERNINKKWIKRGLSFLLVSVLLAFSIPGIVHAASAECKIGDQTYTFADAITAANAATGDVTIELLTNVSIDGELALQNANGKHITLDGNGKTITAAGKNNTLYIHTDVTLCDFTIVHNNTGSAFQIMKCCEVLIEDVTINASAKVTRNWTLINALGVDSTTKLTLNRVDVTLGTGSTPKDVLSAIRTGNAHSGAHKTKLDVNINNCSFDVSSAAGACVIYVTNDTEGEIKITNTDMVTTDAAIMANNMNFTLSNCTWKSIYDKYHINDNQLITDSKNVKILTESGTRIYAVQSTAPQGGTFDLRFISALKKSEKELYDSLEVKVTASYGGTVYFSNTYNVKSVYESLSGKTLEGYYLAPVVIEDVAVRPNDTYFAVRLYGKKGNETTLIDRENFTYKNGLHVTDSLNKTDYSKDVAELSARYLLISDIHYTLSEQSGYVNRVTFRGYHTDDRMKFMCNEIKAEFYRRGLDAIFVLGDLSTDDYPARHTSINYCDQVYDKYLKPLSDELGIPVHIIAGNHDSYPNDMWKQIAGTDRQFTWVNPETGDVFILLDSYDTSGGKLATGGAGNPWSGIDEVWLEAELEKYKNSENVFLATHYFGREGNSDHATEIAQLNSLLAKYPNVKALFDAHTHNYSSSQKLANGKWIINTGAYSYDCVKNTNGKYDFDNISIGNLWGFHVLEVAENSIISYRIETEHTYTVNSSSHYSNSTLENLRSYYTPYVKFEEIVH